MISLEEIHRARRAIAGAALRTPLLRLDVDAPCQIWLKPECLQPLGSFKIRGAVSAVRQAPREAVAAGVVTASAGNMAQGVAWAAREAGVPATVAVPEHAPRAKTDAVERLGGRVVRLPFHRWWRVIEESRLEGAGGLFVHPVHDRAVMAGNGTIGVEIVDDLPEVEAVVCPFGGGGLVAGIASAVKALSPGTAVYTVEPETAAPLAASLAAGRPQAVDYRPSFVDGAGGRLVLPAMWPLVRELVDGALTATLEETAEAVRLLAQRARLVSEGAGALAVAAAVAGRAGSGRVVCVVSGGNIDPPLLTRILAGETPP